jgi:hypothetical protein
MRLKIDRFAVKKKFCHLSTLDLAKIQDKGIIQDGGKSISPVLFSMNATANDDTR